MILNLSPFKLTLLIIVLISYLIFFLASLSSYPGSGIIYSLFSLIYAILIFGAILKFRSYSYLFLSVFLWLGLWFKMSVHLILDYPYGEVTGNFYIINGSMDDVAIVASVGALALIAVYLFFLRLNIKDPVEISTKSKKYPVYYKLYLNNKNKIFFIFWSMVLVTTASNIFFNIQISGLVPRTILIYPLNALVYWALSIGFVLTFTFMIGLRYRLEGAPPSMLQLLSIGLLTSMTSIAILSRGQYVFIVSAVFVYTLFNYKFIFHSSKKSVHSKFSLLLLILSYLVFFYIVIVTVDFLRGYYFDLSLDAGNIVASLSLDKFSTSLTDYSEFYRILLQLVVDRWIGLEGIMAVTSYPDKGAALILEALTRTHNIGEIDIYQKISNSHYKGMDNFRVSFATIPGIFAFLYYSGSLLVVFFGSFVIGTLMLFFEYFVKRMLKCSLTSAIISIYLSNIVSQFGLFPVNIFKSLFILLIFLIFARIIISSEAIIFYLRSKTSLL